jgi:hypothetical protein
MGDAVHGVGNWGLALGDSELAPRRGEVVKHIRAALGAMSGLNSALSSVEGPE